jgi:peptidyl-prolyl cis-trans isomerase C
MARGMLVTVLALLCVMFVAGCSKEEAEEEVEPAQQKVEAGDIVITVNGESVTAGELASEVSRLMQIRSRGLNPRDLEPTRRAMRKEASTTIVKRLLLKQEAEKQNIEIPEEKVEERFTMIKDDFGSEEVFKARIARMNMTEEGIRRDVASGLAIEKLIEMHTASLPEPSEEELRAYYNEHIDWYTEPEKVRASHILIRVNPADDDEARAQKRAGVEELLEKARGGANFAQLAVQHSECPSKSRGGDLDFFAREQMVEEFSTAAFALDVGEISDIVETQFGYHIIKVTDRKEGRVVPFAEASERVATHYENEAKQTAINEFIERLRAAAQITFADSTLVD